MWNYRTIREFSSIRDHYGQHLDQTEPLPGLDETISLDILAKLNLSQNSVTIHRLHLVEEVPRMDQHIGFLCNDSLPRRQKIVIDLLLFPLL
jgi:hypothetical protein